MIWLWHLIFTDIDECTDGGHNCHGDATCTNTPAGSFTCQCNNGFTDTDTANPGTMCSGKPTFLLIFSAIFMCTFHVESSSCLDLPYA